VLEGVIYAYGYILAIVLMTPIASHLGSLWLPVGVLLAFNAFLSKNIPLDGWIQFFKLHKATLLFPLLACLALNDIRGRGQEVSQLC